VCHVNVISRRFAAQIRGVALVSQMVSQMVSQKAVLHIGVFDEEGYIMPVALYEILTD